MAMTYEVNANGNRHFSSTNAQSVASVAVTWKKQGHEPKAWRTDDNIRSTEVSITSVKATAAALTRGK